MSHRIRAFIELLQRIRRLPRTFDTLLNVILLTQLGGGYLDAETEAWGQH